MEAHILSRDNFDPDSGLISEEVLVHHYLERPWVLSEAAAAHAKSLVGEFKLSSAAEGMLRTYLREAIRLNSTIDSIHEFNPQPVSPTPTFYEMKSHIFEHDYVTKVLGIKVPLNESYPYSGAIYQKIIQEQKLAEDFFRFSDEHVWTLVTEETSSMHRPSLITALYGKDDQLDELFGIGGKKKKKKKKKEGGGGDEEDVSPWSWKGMKKLGGDVKMAAKAFKVMALNPKKIGNFVSSLWDSIKKPFETMKNFFTMLIEKGKEWGMKLMAKIGGFAEKVWGWITSAVDKVKSMSGWKQALGVAAVGVALKYFWDEYGDIVDEGLEKITELSELITDAASEAAEPIMQLAKKESLVYAPSLIGAVYGTLDKSSNRIAEWGPFGKKNKESDKMGLEITQGSEVPSAGILISPEQAKSAGIKGKSKEEAEKEKEGASGEGEGKKEEGEKWWAKLGISQKGWNTVKEKVTAIFKWIKEKVIDKLLDVAKDMLSGLAETAVGAVASGGIIEFIKGLGKLYSGAAFVLDFISPSLSSVVDSGEIKDEEKDAGSEEAFWEEGTEEAKKKNESLLRQIIREALLLDKRTEFLKIKA